MLGGRKKFSAVKYVTHRVTSVRVAKPSINATLVVYYSLKIVGQNGLQYLVPILHMYIIANIVVIIAKPYLEAKIRSPFYLQYNNVSRC